MFFLGGFNWQQPHLNYIHLLGGGGFNRQQPHANYIHLEVQITSMAHLEKIPISEGLSTQLHIAQFSKFHTFTKLPSKLCQTHKVSSVSWACNIIWILFYCGLYTMAIDVVTWKIIKKWCIWSLHLRNFLWLLVFALFLQNICRLSLHCLNFKYI